MQITTVATIIAWLLPITWSHGTGAGVMKRIAAPMVGGLFNSLLLEVDGFPVTYYLWKSKGMREGNTE